MKFGGGLRRPHTIPTANLSLQTLPEDAFDGPEHNRWPARSQPNRGQIDYLPLIPTHKTETKSDRPVARAKTLKIWPLMTFAFLGRSLRIGLHNRGKRTSDHTVFFENPTQMVELIIAWFRRSGQSTPDSFSVILGGNFDAKGFDFGRAVGGIPDSQLWPFCVNLGVNSS